MSPQDEEQRYDNVQITNVVDGTTVAGHEDVKGYIAGEEKLQAEHGSAIYLQVYRLNLQADSLETLQGERLAEIKVPGSFATTSDSVAQVKDRVRALLSENAATPVAAEDRLTLYLSGRPLQEDSAFYDDNYILLPVWIQVLLHRCESAEAVQRINSFVR